VECVQPKGFELKNWMTAHAAKQGKKLHPASAERLASINWPNMRELAGEIERLALFAGDGQTITVADLESMGSSSFLMDRFKLPDAVGNGKLGEALETIRNLEQWNIKPIQIMYDLQSLFQKLWLIEFYVKKGTVGKAAGELGLHPFVVEKYTKFLAAAGPNAGGSGLLRCLEADLNVKRGIRGESLELQMLVTDLVRLIRGKKG
jgi:DNA polymerase-3 subunit delta